MAAAPVMAPGFWGGAGGLLRDGRPPGHPPRDGTEQPRAKPFDTKVLGKPSALPASPDQAILDRVPNPQTDTNYVARFAFPEFTSMWPGHATRPRRTRD